MKTTKKLSELSLKKEVISNLRNTKGGSGFKTIKDPVNDNGGPGTIVLDDHVYGNLVDFAG